MKMVLTGFLVMVAALVAMSSSCAALQEVGLDDGRRAVEMPEDMAPVPVAVAWYFADDWTPVRCQKNSRESCSSRGGVIRTEGVADDVLSMVSGRLGIHQEPSEAHPRSVEWRFRYGDLPEQGEQFWASCRTMQADSDIVRFSDCFHEWERPSH